MMKKNLVKGTSNNTFAIKKNKDKTNKKIKDKSKRYIRSNRVG